ncbi:MAG: hydroxymethylpyrimidine/phosphomethylpyrimidine kinase [Chitinophagales bacterium]|nr:hydroxymethylpyrimidine/phosphomethylpyrimidine kinase [Chitinophagales bacterium]
MQSKRPYSLTIAGFDPSGGAGALADAKTFEQLNVFGLAACTAITLQTENEFKGVSWIPLHQIELQIETLLAKYDVAFAKIGLIQNLETLNELLFFLERKFPSLKIIWDPILKSSSGFNFHNHFDEGMLFNILSKILLITPNASEANLLMQSEDAMHAAKELNRFCNVFLKSYKKGNEHADVLLEKRSERVFVTREVIKNEKHGSGCVLSAAITAMLSKGASLSDACATAKEYSFQFLNSDEGLLGMHHQIKILQHA